MGVATAVVLGVYRTPGPWTPGVSEVVSGGDGSGSADHRVAHALGHPAAAHAHGGAHVGRTHRGHRGSHPVVGRVERLHRRPATPTITSTLLPPKSLSSDRERKDIHR